MTDLQFSTLLQHVDAIKTLLESVGYAVIGVLFSLIFAVTWKG